MARARALLPPPRPSRARSEAALASLEGGAAGGIQPCAPATRPGPGSSQRDAAGKSQQDVPVPQ
eukprot:8607597-Pyramimonas_sp.AAC.1